MLGTFIKGSLLGSFLYAAAPFADASISRTVDIVSADHSLPLSQQKYPETVKSMIVIQSLHADGLHASDSLKYFYARYSGNLDTCFSEEKIDEAHGRVLTAVHDNAECLSDLTGVAIRDLEPETNGNYYHQRFVRIHGREPGIEEPEL